MKHLFEALWLIAAFVSLSVVYYLIKGWLHRRRKIQKRQQERLQREIENRKWQRAQLLSYFDRLCREEIQWFEIRPHDQPHVSIQISKGPGKQNLLIETPVWDITEPQRKKLFRMGALSFRVVSDACQMEFKAESFGFAQFVEQLLQFLTGSKELKQFKLKA